MRKVFFEPKSKLSQLARSASQPFQAAWGLVQLNLLLLVFLVSGCSPDSPRYLYQNSETGISLARPANWDVSYYERNGMITLTSGPRIWDMDSARIEISAGSCYPDSAGLNSPYKTSFEILEQEIHRIGMLYALESLNIAQAPMPVERTGYEVAKATVMIPTMAMLEDSNRIQVGKPDPAKFQTVDVFVIRDSDNTIMAWIYKGSCQELNAQAQEIVDSIQRLCPGKL